MKGQWSRAITVQLTVSAASLVLLVVELGVLRLTGIGAEQTVHVPAWIENAGLWKQAAIIAGVALLDLLLVSPLKLGQAAYYEALTAGQEPVGGKTCAFRPVVPSVQEAEDLSRTHEFVPPRAEKEAAPQVPVRILWRFYRQGYGRAVGWRAVLWGWRTLYGLLCYLPATLLFGYSDMIRLSGDISPLGDVTRLFCGLFGLFALLAGWVVQQLLMFRFLPAQYLLAQGATLRESLRGARRRMKGHIGRTARLYLGFSGWLAACVLVFPFYYVSPLFLATRAAFVRRLPVREKKKALALRTSSPGRQIG